MTVSLADLARLNTIEVLMYTLEQRATIEKVTLLEEFKGSILFTQKNCVYQYSPTTHTHDLLYQEEKRIGALEIYRDECIIINEHIIYDQHSSVRLDNKREVVNIIGERLLIRDIDHINESIKYLSYDPKKGAREELNNDDKMSPVYLSDEYLVNISTPSGSGVIQFVDLHSGQKTNTIPFEEFLNNSNAKPYGSPQFSNNKIVFFLFDKSHQSNDKITVCLDIGEHSVQWSDRQFSGLLTTHEDKIFAISGKVVQIFDPLTLDKTVIDLQEQLCVLDKKIDDPANLMTWDVKFELSRSIYCIRGNLLYFSEENKNSFGVIDLESKQLLFHKEIVIDSGEFPATFIKIKVVGSYLYLVDSANVLHIYEIITA